MDATSKNHCIVIGAGIVGASCAWHLTRSGRQVTLVDHVLPGQSTSFGNAACISPSQVVPNSYPGIWKSLPRWLFDPLGPLFIRWRDLPGLSGWLWKFWRAGSLPSMRHSASAQAGLMRRVADDYAEILQQCGLQEWVRARGCIEIYDSRKDFEANRWALDLESEYGFEWQLLTPAELRSMAPQLSLDNGVAVYLPQWQHTLDPARLTAGIAEAAFAGGANWLQDRVQQVRATANGVQVTTLGGQQLHADELVIAAGAWSNALAEQVDFRVPLAPKRGYHSMIAQPGLDLAYPVISGSRMFVMTPMADGLRLAGTAEFAALDAAPDYSRARVLVQHARDYLPGLQVEGVSEWMGQRPMMCDSLPVISASPSSSRVFYAFGHGHYGLTQGPTTGRLITCLVEGRDAGMDLAPYRIDRFGRH